MKARKKGLNEEEMKNLLILITFISLLLAFNIGYVYSNANKVTGSFALTGVVRASTTWDRIEPGVTKQMIVSNANSAIREINFTTNKLLIAPFIQLGSIKAESSDLAPSGVVYQYIQIVKYNMPDESINGIKIKYTVPNSWITSNNVSKDSIKLNRLNNDTWMEVYGNYLYELDNYSYYVATPEKLSIFAIVGQAINIPAPVVEEKVIVPSEVPKEKPMLEKVKEKITEKTSPYGAIIISILIILLAIGYFFYSKTKKNKKR